MKKFIPFLLCFCILFVSCTGCGREKPTATDSVKAIYDLYILRKTDGVKKLGMTDEEITSALNAYDNTLKETIRANFSTSGLTIDDETLDKICKARNTALSKMKATYQITSEENDHTVVTLSTTYFDEITLDTDAAYNAREAADNAGFDDYDEYLNFIMETYTENLIAGYENVTPSEDTRDIVVTCIIVDNQWIPEDMATFGSELGYKVTGQIE